MAGLPGINVPCGLDSRRLPIGLQIIAGHFQEERLLHVAYAFEQATVHHAERAVL
jgi:aspartyl-tRNA(Asn)/glutamyl-tRNA(Gln) amidotransferase subunit A